MKPKKSSEKVSWPRCSQIVVEKLGRHTVMMLGQVKGEGSVSAFFPWPMQRSSANVSVTGTAGDRATAYLTG